MNTSEVLLNNEEGIISYLKGQAQAFISDIGVYKDVPDRIKISDALCLEGSFIAEIGWAGYRILYPSLNGQEDLFYICLENKIEIGLDFYEICNKWRNQLTYDQGEVSYFEKEGLFRPGCTYFKEVRRVKIGEAIVLWDEGGWDLISLPLKKWSITENTYRQALIAYLKLQNPGSEKEYILFSGGRDSVLLTLLLKYELGCDLNLIMGKSEGIDWGENDEYRRDYFSKRLSTPIDKVLVNYDDYTFEDLEYLTDNMPLTAHMGVVFHALNKRIKINEGRAWTGQDADAMYAIGMTGGVIRSVLARGIISDMYIGSLDDVSDFRWGQLYGKILASICSHKNGRPFYAPSNVNELREAVQEKYATLPLLDSNYCIRSQKRSEKVTISQVRKELLFDKMSYYVVARDHRIITYAGEITQRPVYPYSSAMMTIVAASMKMGLRDVLINKRYISNLIKRYIGNKDFRQLYPLELFHSQKNIFNGEDYILHNTRYGISLGEYAGSSCKTIQEALSKAWLRAVMDKLKWKDWHEGDDS